MGVFWFRKLSVDSNVSWFLFLTIKHIWKYKNTENVHKLSFWGMNCSNLEYFTKHSVCLRQNFQDITQIINVNLAMKLECSFVCFWSQNGTYIPNWLLFSSWLAISNVSNRWSLLYKVFHWFLVFLGNPEIAESFSLLFFKGVNAFWGISKIMQIIQCD